MKYTIFSLLVLGLLLSGCSLLPPLAPNNISDNTISNNETNNNLNQNANTDISANPSYCQNDADCVKATCCHPTTAVNKNNAPNCTGIICDLSCQGPLDCGAGKIVCENNQCAIKATNNEEPIPATIKNSLNLSNQQLSKIPEYVFGQKNLEELNVSNNQLTGAIQAEIRQLQNLRILNASNNLMTGVPAEIGQLANLEILDLSNNQLTGLPYELGNLKNLKTLNISGNNYSELDLGIISEKLPASVNIIK